MDILFYDTKPYDREAFAAALESYPDIKIKFLKADLTENTARLARGFDAVCGFVSSEIGKATVEIDGGPEGDGRYTQRVRH